MCSWNHVGKWNNKCGKKEKGQRKIVHNPNILSVGKERQHVNNVKGSID